MPHHRRAESDSESDSGTDQQRRRANSESGSNHGNDHAPRKREVSVRVRRPSCTDSSSGSDSEDCHEEKKCHPCPPAECKPCRPPSCHEDESSSSSSDDDCKPKPPCDNPCDSGSDDDDCDEPVVCCNLVSGQIGMVDTLTTFPTPPILLKLAAPKAGVYLFMFSASFYSETEVLNGQVGLASLATPLPNISLRQLDIGLGRNANVASQCKFELEEGAEVEVQLANLGPTIRVVGASLNFLYLEPLPVV